MSACESRMGTFHRNSVKYSVKKTERHEGVCVKSFYNYSFKVCVSFKKQKQIKLHLCLLKLLHFGLFSLTVNVFFKTEF